VAVTGPGYEVPGWFFLRMRRHAERLTGLDDAELSALDRRARDLVAAVTEATAAPATYDLDVEPWIRRRDDVVALGLVVRNPVLPATRGHPEAVDQKEAL
jgi:hypothetical protein